MPREMKLCRKCNTVQECYTSQTKCIACAKAEPSQSKERQKERRLKREARDFQVKISKQKYMKNWQEENQDRVKQYRIDNRERAKLNYKKWWLKTYYGITLEEYENILKAQDYRCAICKTDEPATGWHVDHCHDTNKVRGLLCTKCNPMLGFANDKPDVLRAAADYLERQEK